MRDDSNGAIRFVIRDLENKFWIFNRNYNFVIEITILPLFQKLEFLGSYNTDIASYQKLLQRRRVHIFLAGLEGDFEQVRDEILRKDPIPELEECYALVGRKDVRRRVMNEQLENFEASTMVTWNRSNQNRSPQH